MYLLCHVTCDFREDDKTMVIENLRSKLELEDYVLRCGEDNVIVLIYRDCYVGDILLPISKLVDNYPNLRTIYWNCVGTCTPVLLTQDGFNSGHPNIKWIKTSSK